MTNLYSLPDFAAALSGAFKPVAENIKRGFSEQAESRKEREAKKRKTEAEIADAIVFRPENGMLLSIVCPHEVGLLRRDTTRVEFGCKACEQIE